MTNGGSSIHIVYKKYVPPATRTRRVKSATDVSPPSINNDGVKHGRNTIVTIETKLHSGDRQLQEILQTGMSIHLYHCSITGGFMTNTSTYRAVLSEGFILSDNVTIQNNYGGILFNIMGGSAILEDSIFVGNTISAAIRVTNGGSIVVRNTNFVQNTGTVSTDG
jgi:hypothetical protein